MAVNQEPMQRKQALPVRTVTAGSGLNDLTKAVDTVGQLLTDRLTEVAIEDAARQGQQDALEGQAPEKLAMPVTKTTRAYNQAVASTETRRMAVTAAEQINEALLRYSDPAKFNSNTPAEFHAALEGIKQGVLDQARDETRGALAENINSMASNASLKMLEHSINYDNRKALNDFQYDTSQLLTARRNAIVAGETERVAGIDSALESTLEDYAVINQQIAESIPEKRQLIEQSKLIDGVITGYLEAVDKNTDSQYLADLSENKQNLPLNVWESATKAVISLDQRRNALANNLNAEYYQSTKNAIDRGMVNQVDEVFAIPNLTTVQKLQLANYLETQQQKAIESTSKVLTAQRNILAQRPESNSDSTRNEMFSAAIQEYEAVTGNDASLQVMEQSLLGLNDFPASGLKDTAIGTNVPKFDQILSGKLVSNDIASTRDAADVYNDIVNVRNRPNAVNITGDALAVATLYNELNQGGTTAEQAAHVAIQTVLHKKDPEVIARSDRFRKDFNDKKLRSVYKSMFGSKAEPFKSDAAYQTFVDTYRAFYIASNSEEAARSATAQTMRGWGTSKYFDDGMVARYAPEKELPIASMGNAFPNMYILSVQAFMERNEKLRQENPELGIPKIEWAHPFHNLKEEYIKNLSDGHKISDDLTFGMKPRIKINGHESDVVLIPDMQSGLGNRISYALGYYDEFNNLQPLPDAANTVTGVARFQPQTIEQFVPGIAAEKQDELFKSIAMDTRQRELDMSKRKNIFTKGLFTLLSPLGSKLLEARAYADLADDPRVNEIIEGFKSRGSANVRESIAEADSVGLKAEGATAEETIAELAVKQQAIDEGSDFR